MFYGRKRKAHRQGVRITSTILALSISACTDRGITNPTPSLESHPGFDTSVYPGDAAMGAWLRPGSPYEWVGYYLQAPCHRDPSWMGKRQALTNMGWGLAVLYVGQQTFDGVPDVMVPPRFDPQRPLNAIAFPDARAGIMVPPTREEIESAGVTCSRTLLTTEQGTADAIDAVTKTASEGFSSGTVIFLDIEHMDVIPASMEAYYRAWIQQVLADGRFHPGVYVHKDNAESIHNGIARAYADLNASGSAVYWITSSTGFSLDASPHDVGFPWASVWQGIYEVSQTWNGATINIDVDVATTSSPSSP
jgi:hypothetical protein